jgi:hypothetical protein
MLRTAVRGKADPSFEKGGIGPRIPRRESKGDRSLPWQSLLPGDQPGVLLNDAIVTEVIREIIGGHPIILFSEGIPFSEKLNRLVLLVRAVVRPALPENVVRGFDLPRRAERARGG